MLTKFDSPVLSPSPQNKIVFVITLVELVSVLSNSCQFRTVFMELSMSYLNHEESTDAKTAGPKVVGKRIFTQCQSVAP